VTNVLILMSDEHNPRVSSVYGHPRVETPHMERLAAEGVVYGAAYCPSPLCSPSRSSFMSGLPPHQTQVYNNCTVVEYGYPSYGKVLADQRVHSVHIGKTDVYTAWDQLGFSEVYRPGDRKNPGDINFGRSPLTVRDDGPERANGYGPRETAFASDTLVVDDAVDWLTTKATSMDQPWALTVNVKAPHFPHYATPELWEKYEGAGDLPEHGADADPASHPYAEDLRRHFQTDAFTEEQVRGLRQGYLAGVDFVDSQLGRLLDALDLTGQREGTVVAYTSDHGEMLGTFGMWWKCSMYEDSARVPLVVGGPGFEKGVRSSTPVSLLDLQASLFHATGTHRPAHWWGDPLQELALDDAERVVIAEYHGHGTRSGTFMVRKGAWKLLYHNLAPNQLFDLVDDPAELVNRYETEPEIADDLERELRLRCDPDAEFARSHAFEEHQLELVRQLTA
jgi:choline-sulfatase